MAERDVMAPVTAREVGNWLKYLAEQLSAGTVSLSSRIRQLASMGLQGANVALSYPGALAESFLTGEPASVPEFRPYDPWKDPAFLRAQVAMGRPVPIPQPVTTRRPGGRQSREGETVGADTQRRRRESTQPLTEADKQRAEFYRQRGTLQPQRLNAGSPSVTPATPLASTPIQVTPVPDQVLLGLASTVQDIQRQGLEPTYFLAPAQVRALSDRPLVTSTLPNVGEATAALASGQVPDQVLMGLYPNVEAMRAAGAQPTYVLGEWFARMPAEGAVPTQPAGVPGWLDLFQRQQDVVDVLGVTTETGQALRLAARRAAQTPGASVAALYWEQGFEPLLRRYGFTEDQLKAKEQELYDLEAEWRRYGMIQDFAEFLWTQGFDPFS